MAQKGKIEVFSAGCPVCDRAISTVEDLADGNYDVEVLDMNDPQVARRADDLGIISVPAVVMDGELLECCGRSGPTRESLQQSGLGA